MNVLLTGINGFAGHHVARYLHDLGHTIIGIGNQPGIAPDLQDFVAQYYDIDLTSPTSVQTVDLTAIDSIINLAGFAKVGSSIGNGELYNQVNVGVHTVLYNECIRQNVSPRIIAISSGAVYDPNQPLPITEESPLIRSEVANEYTVSKILMEEAIQDLIRKGLDCIVVRPFNHSGPEQLPGFLIPDLGEQITNAIQSGEPLLVGNLDTRRDYTDVRDVARAYVELATCERSNLRYNLYNICSGKSTAGKEILQLMMDAFGAKDVTTEVDPKKIRPNEILEIYGSRERLTADTGWQPQISVEQMIRDYASWKQSQ